jgi:lycopene beta-cyclase
MNNEKIYDYIIAGAGAAGLSLLATLTESSLAESNILVIDFSLEPKSDKTWCFWNHNHRFMKLTHHSWSKLEVISGDEYIEANLKNYGYHCIRSEKYHKHILSTAQHSENITFIESEILELKARDDMGIVITRNGTYKANWVFQSVLKHPDHPNSVVDTSLLQHFTGWEIETSEAVFNPGKATFMDFNTEQLGGLTFFYVLPFTEKQALIEHTIFSDHTLERKKYESAIKKYLLDRFKIKNEDYRIIREEKGSIPMEDRRVPSYYNNKTLSIGTAGGITKATTGYTFTRAHDHSYEIVRALENNKKPAPFSGSSYRFRVYDIMLLYLLKNENDNGKHIFHELFKKNDMELLLKFLDEKTSFLEELKIFSTLPYIPFFRSIYKMKHRIFTGA